jgi:hypothetical protein
MTSTPNTVRTVARWLFAACGLAFAVAAGSVILMRTPENRGIFEEITASSGISFTHRNGEERTPELLTILESLGGGGAAIDYDNDGLLDLVLVGGGTFDGVDGRMIRGQGSKLFHNRGGFHFVEQSESILPAPAGGWFYAHGAAVADFDRDGWPDLLLSGWRRVALYHNESDGQGGRRFKDVTSAMGLDRGIGWATSAAFADLDGDGWSDLYVCQYADWSFDNHPTCSYDGRTPDICPPTIFRGLPHKVFRNQKGQRFDDVSREAGLHPGGDKTSYGLGVVVVDLDGDGKPEIYVANDSAPNFLYRNESTPGSIRLREVGMAAGVAVDGGGRPTGSMGVDVGDPEGTGRPALWVTNFENEVHAVYRNESSNGRLRFAFASESAGVAAIGKKFVGWGTGFADFDRDGHEDLIVAHGHAVRHPIGAPRRQQPVLLMNDGGRFIDRSSTAGPYFLEPHPGRGVILADFDNDGRTDAVITHVNEPAVVLRNVSRPNHHWIGIEWAPSSQRSLVGAKVEMNAGGRTQTRFCKGGGSYASSGDPRILFGLGRIGTVDSITITWPDGTHTDLEWPKIDHYHRIHP